MAYSGWEIDEQSRADLLTLFVPTYPDVIAHHVTAQRGVPADAQPPEHADIQIIGHVCRDGVEALVVEVNGSKDRPYGGVYHITWSIDRAAGAKPVHSNDLIREHGYVPIALRAPVKTTPKVFY